MLFKCFINYFKVWIHYANLSIILDQFYYLAVPFHHLIYLNDKIIQSNFCLLYISLFCSFCVIFFKVDGSTLLWDLSDNAQGSLDGSLSLKVPTYSTG